MIKVDPGKAATKANIQHQRNIVEKNLEVKPPQAVTNRLPASNVKLPVELQKPVKTPKPRTNKNTSTISQADNQILNKSVIKQVIREDEGKPKEIRKKIIPIAPKKKNVAGTRPRRKIIFQTSRIIRYKQTRAKSSSK